MSFRSTTIRIPQRCSYVQMTHKNKASRGFSFSKVLNITRHKAIVLIFLAALLISGFWITHETQKMAKDIESLQIEKDHLNAQYQDFSIQMDRLKAHSHMEKLGKKIGLHPPTDRQTIFLN